MSRVHSHTHSTTSGVNLMTHEYHSGSSHLAGNNSIIGNPINNLGGSNSSLSAGASTILAASLEREAQKERENYTATVKHIISRAAMVRESHMYGEQVEDKSISNDNLTSRSSWMGNVHENGFLTRGKKLSWDNPHSLQHDKVILILRNFLSLFQFVYLKVDVMCSVDDMGSTENNLTVYF